MERKTIKVESCIFYGSFYEAIKELPKEDQADVYNAIFAFAFEGERKELKGVKKAIFGLIQPIIESNRQKYLNGCKGGRPNAENKGEIDNQSETETKPNRNLTETETKPNRNLTETETVKSDNQNVTKAEPNKDKDKDIYKEVEEKESREKENVANAPAPLKRFIKPSLEEITAYCKERNNKVNAQMFYDFYESKGWKVGNQPMKDWQACVRTWEERDGYQSNTGGGGNGFPQHANSFTRNELTGFYSEKELEDFENIEV